MFAIDEGGRLCGADNHVRRAAIRPGSAATSHETDVPVRCFTISPSGEPLSTRPAKDLQIA